MNQSSGILLSAISFIPEKKIITLLLYARLCPASSLSLLATLLPAQDFSWEILSLRLQECRNQNVSPRLFSMVSWGVHLGKNKERQDTLILLI